MDQRTTKQVVLITGVTSGIGRAAALAFAARGARLALGSRGEAAGEALAREASAAGGEAIFVPTDVTREGDLRRLVGRALETFGRLDVAVNNAGVEAVGPLEGFDEETYARVFDTNVKGVFWAMKAELGALRRGGGGAIVNVSSTAGSRGFAGASVYTASKHAVEGLSRAAALELAPENIRVNVVAPGPTATPMLDRFTGGKPEALTARVPLGRAATPDEVAAAIVWVASPEAAFVTGAVLPVNGGLTAA